MDDLRCRLSYRDDEVTVIVRWTEAEDDRWAFRRNLSDFLERLRRPRLEHELAEVVRDALEDLPAVYLSCQPGLAEATKEFLRAARTLCECWEDHDEKLLGPDKD